MCRIGVQCLKYEAGTRNASEHGFFGPAVLNFTIATPYKQLFTTFIHKCSRKNSLTGMDVFVRIV